MSSYRDAMSKYGHMPAPAEKGSPTWRAQRFGFWAALVVIGFFIYLGVAADPQIPEKACVNCVSAYEMLP